MKSNDVINTQRKIKHMENNMEYIENMMDENREHMKKKMNENMEHMKNKME
jgi:hypothetical protein